MLAPDRRTPPSPRILRQFAAAWLVVLGGAALRRASQGQTGAVTIALGALAVIVGGAGLVRPAAVRVVYTASMMAAFPIGWVVSRIMLAAIFYLLFTPVAGVFRLIGRDALRLRKRAAASHWTACPAARTPAEYFRQS